MTEAPVNCPFCGMNGEAKYTVDYGGRTIFQCQWCGASHHSFDDWNNRPIEDELRTRIAELEAATRPIPVTEKLPDDNVRVIVFDTTLERVGIARHVAQVPQWATDDGVFYHNDSYGWITHWQPLPQPPEAE